MMRRLDRVVILARGLSSRMGSPKGLLPCPDDPNECFAARIATGYERLGLGGVLVCPDDLVGEYSRALVGCGGFSVVGGPGAGETGLTLNLGWVALGTEPTHLWAHPVDLPLVTAETLTNLLAGSTRNARQIVRPCCGGVPGHPVVVPSACLTALSADAVWRTAPMREVIAAGQRSGRIQAPIQLPVGDSGVVRDFDRPGDFECK